MAFLSLSAVSVSAMIQQILELPNSGYAACSWSRLVDVIDWFRRRFGVSAVLTMLGAVVSAVGGVWVFAYENQSVGVPAVVVLIGAVITTAGAFLSSGERTRFEHDLRERSDEIARLNREIMHSVTGGDSFCYLTIGSFSDSSPNKGFLTLLHKGQHTLYDVSFRMVDLQEFRKTVNQDQSVWPHLVSNNVEVGNVSPHSAVMVRAWELPNTDEQDYNIQLYARNGFFTQLLRLRRCEGNWKQA